MRRWAPWGLAALVVTTGWQAVPYTATARDVAPDARPRYTVDPVAVTVTLAAPPADVVWADQAITITRGRASRQERVRYTVAGDFISEEGRTLPAPLVRVQNEYGDPPGSYDVLVLTGGDNSAVFRVQVVPQAWQDDADPTLWRYAGRYTGQLTSAVFGVPPIDVTVDIRPYQSVTAVPEQFTVVAQPEDMRQVGPWGPGTYPSAETVTVTVQANHRGWGLWREFVAPAMEANPSRIIPLSQLAVSEAGGPYEPVTEGPHLWLAGGSLSEPRRCARTVRLQVTLTWNDWAGRYQGHMDLNMGSTH